MRHRAVVATGGGVEVQWVPFGGLETLARPGVRPRGYLPHGAVLEVLAAGLCGSDLGALGHQEEGTVCGHEVVGVVTAVGPEVRTVRVGDVVVAPFNVACGHCPSCRAGMTSLCETAAPDRRGATYGLGLAVGGWLGFQAQAATVPWADANLVVLPDREWARAHTGSAVLLTDAVPTALHALAQGAIGPGVTTYVAGAGPVGLLVAWFAQRVGAHVVIGDHRADRRAAATRVGLAVLDPAAEAGEGLAECTGGHQAEVVVDCVGGRGPRSLDAATALLAPGGRLVLVGVHTEPGGPVIPAAAVWRNSWTVTGGSTPARRYLGRALACLQAGEWALEEILAVTSIPLEDAAQAYDQFARGAGEKVVLIP